MELLLYSHAFAPMVGGVETYTLLLAGGLPNCGDFKGSPIALTVATQTPADPQFDGSLPFPVVRQPGWLRLFALIRSADVIQLAGPAILPMIFAVLLRKPFVIEQHLYQPVCPNGLLLYESTAGVCQVCPEHFMARHYNKCLRCNAASVGWIASAKMLLLTFPRRWLCKRASVNVAVTSHVDRRLALPRTQVIYHGLPDPLVTHEGTSEAVMGGNSPTVTFAYVGRFVREKGLLLLLSAARSLNEQGYDFQLKLIGDGPQREALERAAREFGLQDRVTFAGLLQGADLEQALEEVAVVIMPSVWEETAGLAAIEQMFRGRLVIASDIGGLGEIVGRAGLKFSPGSRESLADCMKQVLERPDMVSRLGKEARDRALSRFALDRMLAEHKAIYLGLFRK